MKQLKTLDFMCKVKRSHYTRMMDQGSFTWNPRPISLEYSGGRGRGAQGKEAALCFRLDNSFIMPKAGSRTD